MLAQRSHNATLSRDKPDDGQKSRGLLKESSRDINITNRHSLRALDATVFFLADVQDGLGPFLAIYLLRVQNWNPSSVGVAMASMVLGTLTTQIPAGALIDRVRWKRAAVVTGAGIVATCCIMMGSMPTLAIVATMQALIVRRGGDYASGDRGHQPGTCRTTTISSPHEQERGVQSLGQCLRRDSGWYGRHVDRLLDDLLSRAMIAVTSAISVLMIREGDIDHEMARGSDRDDGHSVSGIRVPIP